MGNTTFSSSSLSTGILRCKKTNVDPQNTPPSLIMMAASRKIFLKKVHVLLLRFAMAKLSDDFGRIRKEGFDRALDTANLANIEILDLLFTMWEDNDDDGEDGSVPYKDFCMGISPLACPADDLSTILMFALRVSDEFDRNCIDRRELYELLKGINSMASFLGDNSLLHNEIVGIVEATFKRAEDTITHYQCVNRLVINPYVKRFVSGKARSNVRFREVLEQNFIFDKEKMVTEYVVDDDRHRKQMPPITINESDDDLESVSIFDTPPSPPIPMRVHHVVSSPVGTYLQLSEHYADMPLSFDSKTSSRDDKNTGILRSSNRTINSERRDPPPSTTICKGQDKPPSPEALHLTFSRHASISPSIRRDPPSQSPTIPGSSPNHPIKLYTRR